MIINSLHRPRNHNNKGQENRNLIVHSHLSVSVVLNFIDNYYFTFSHLHILTIHLQEFSLS